MIGCDDTIANSERFHHFRRGESHFSFEARAYPSPNRKGVAIAEVGHNDFVVVPIHAFIKIHDPFGGGFDRNDFHVIVTFRAGNRAGRNA